MSPDPKPLSANSATSPELRLAVIGAILSLLLGLASVVLLLRAVAAIPALLIGLLSLRRLNLLEDQVASPLVPRFRTIAIGGMMFGLAGLVMAGIGLVSLILTRVAESGRRETCMDNLRRLGMSVAAYHDLFDHLYPPATVNAYSPVDALAPWRMLPYPDRLSWTVNLLPLLGVQPDLPGSNPARGARRASQWDSLYQSLNPRRSWSDPANEAGAKVLHAFVCPSRPGSLAPPGPTSYPGIAGLGPDAAELTFESPRAGFFGYERLLWTGKNHDPFDAGTSNTLLAAETDWHTGPWASGGSATVRPIDPALKPYIGLGRPFGGLHPGGANLLMVDASVRFFSERGKPLVLEHLSTLMSD